MSARGEDLHDEIAAALCERVEAACEGARSWRERTRAALSAALGFLREDPARARFFAVEASAAGRPAQACLDRVVVGLAELLDAGRAEPGGHVTASPIAAEIAAGAIFQAIRQRILAGGIDRGGQLLPELLYIATMPYLGARAAEGPRPLRDRDSGGGGVSGTEAVSSGYAQLE